METVMRITVNHSSARLSLLWSLLLSVLEGCENGNTYQPPPPPQVTVSHPAARLVSRSIEFTGNTQAFYTVQLRARVEGYLEKVLFKEGDIVEPGQVLFVIQQNTYQSKLKEAQAELLAAKARLMHSATEYQRFTGLKKEDAAAQTDVDRWHFERDANQAQVLSAEAQVELAQLNLDYTTVKAPFRGRVSRRYKDPGNVVGAGEETVLADINKIDPIYVYFTISEQDLLRIRREDPALAKNGARPPDVPIAVGLANETGYPHKARLDYADIQVDTTTGTLQLRATLPNPDYRILPGLFVRIRAERQEPQPALLLPEEAIGFDQAGSYVLVVDAKNVVARRGVTLGPQVNRQFAIEAGVSADDRVITNGQARAIPGRPVTPMVAASDDAGAAR
jgi:RND family efflux transporter MFP subunit